MDQPIIELKPKVSVAIIPTIFWGLILSSLIGFYVGGLLARSILVSFIVAGFIIIISVFFKLMNLNARKYIFYKDQAEFYEGFLNILQKNVKYSKITDSSLSKSVWDRMFGTGTITLATAGNLISGNKAIMGGGIVMQYIEDPERVYSYLQRILKIH
ncbi:MAG: PH domain-containing protein [Nanoarchaeota archaeon]